MPAEDVTSEAVGPWLRRRREASGLTQEELAARAGLSVRSLSDLERGRSRKPYPRSIRMVAQALGLPDAVGDELVARLRTGSGQRPGVRPVVVPRQLPAATARFVGRGAEIKALDELLDQDGAGGTAVVISAIEGTAGIGKTALALCWAHRCADWFEDGQLYVNLRGFDPSAAPVEPVDVLGEFLVALGVTRGWIPAEPDARAALYRSVLAGRRVLVVLDNARDAAQVRPLLPGTPTCRAVVTSRNRMTSLISLEGARPLLLDVLSDREAADLLSSRLGPVRIAAEPEMVSTLIAMCARLPLALAVVAARASAVPARPLTAIAAELVDPGLRLDALADRDSRADVRTVLSWSYRSLSAAGARMLRLLGLHPGPDIGLVAAASLAGTPVPETRTVLTELAEANLLTEPETGRFALHDLLRAYAVERARVEDGPTERAAATRRALHHYLHYAFAAALLLNPTRDPITVEPLDTEGNAEAFGSAAQAGTWLHAELPVLLRIPEWAAGAGFDVAAWQVAWALVDHLERQGRWHELVGIQRVAVAAARHGQNLTGMAHGHHYLALGLLRLRSYSEALAHLRTALDLHERCGNRYGMARTHLSHGRLLAQEGRYDEALHHVEQALALFRRLGHVSGQANALNNAGWYHAHSGDLDRALARCAEALELFHGLGDRGGQSRTWDSLGLIHHRMGRQPEAVDAYEHALGLYAAEGDRYNQYETLVRLGSVHETAGEPQLARQAWVRALAILDDLEHPDAQQLFDRVQALGDAPRPGPLTGTRPGPSRGPDR